MDIKNPSKFHNVAGSSYDKIYIANKDNKTGRISQRGRSVLYEKIISWLHRQRYGKRADFATGPFTNIIEYDSFRFVAKVWKRAEFYNPAQFEKNDASLVNLTFIKLV